MDMQKEKEAFANWFGASFTNGKIEFDADGVPIGYEKAIAWKAWKAAKTHANQHFESFVNQAIEDSACAEERQTLQRLLEELQEQK